MCVCACVCVLCCATPTVIFFQLQNHSCIAIGVPPTSPHPYHAVHTCPASNCSVSLSVTKSVSLWPEPTLLLWRQAKYCEMNVPRRSPQPTTFLSWCINTHLPCPSGRMILRNCFWHLLPELPQDWIPITHSGSWLITHPLLVAFSHSCLNSLSPTGVPSTTCTLILALASSPGETQTKAIIHQRIEKLTKSHWTNSCPATPIVGNSPQKNFKV